jgi:hypothetical protein
MIQSIPLSGMHIREEQLVNISMMEFVHKDYRFTMRYQNYLEMLRNEPSKEYTRQSPKAVAGLKGLEIGY